jgi:putative ABC transport system permease protein
MMPRALLGHARLAVAPLVAVAVIVFVMAAMLAAVPALTERTATQELTTSLAELPEARRALVAKTLGLPPVRIPAEPGADAATTWAPVKAQLAEMAAGAGGALAPILGEPQIAAVSGATPVNSAAREGDWPNMMLRTLIDPDFDSRIRVVEGAAPLARDWTALENGGFFGTGGDWGPLQIMLSTDSAELMRWPVGEVRQSVNWMPVQLTGVFEPIDPDDQYWHHVPSVLQPSIFDDGNSAPVVTAIGVAHPFEVESLFSSTTTVFMPLDTDAVTFASAETMGRQLQRFTAARHQLADGESPLPALTLAFETDALAVVELAAGRASAAISTVVALAVPPVGAAAGILAVIAASAARRQASPVAVARSRGASGWQVRFVAAGQVAAVAVPAAVLGALAPASFGIVPAAVPTVVGAAALVVVAVVVAAAAPIAPIDVAADRRAPGMRSRVARLVAESAVVLAAVTALVLLITGGGPAADGPGPIAMLAPLLVAVAASLAVVRALPPLLAVLARRGRRARGLVPFVGPVAARGAMSASAVLVLTTVIAVAVSSAAALILARIDLATNAEAGDELLADVRVIVPMLSASDLDALAGIDGVASVVPATFATGVGTAVDRRLGNTAVLVVDVAAVPALVGFADSTATVAGEVVTVAVSPSMRDAAEAAQAQVNGVEIEVATVLPASVLRDLTIDLVVADAADGAQLVPGSRVSDVALIDLEGGDRAAALESIRATAPTGAAVDALDERVAEIAGQPLTALLRVALITIALGALALAVVGIVSAAAAGARQRTGTFGILRVLGARRRELAALGTWELLPAALASVLVGAVVGVVLAWLAFAAIDLSVFVGASSTLSFAVDPLVLGVVVVAVLLAVLGTVVAANAVAMLGTTAQTQPAGGS